MVDISNEMVPSDELQLKKFHRIISNWLFVN